MASHCMCKIGAGSLQLCKLMCCVQMLDDFVDVSNDEKDVMHLWNSFVRKQRYDARFSHLKNQIEMIYDRGL
jgi:hypothetical protein